MADRVNLQTVFLLVGTLGALACTEPGSRADEHRVHPCIGGRNPLPNYTPRTAAGVRLLPDTLSIDIWSAQVVALDNADQFHALGLSGPDTVFAPMYGTYGPNGIGILYISPRN